MAIVIPSIDTSLELLDLVVFIHQPGLVDGLFEPLAIFLLEAFPLSRMIDRDQHHGVQFAEMAPIAFRYARGFLDAIAVDHRGTAVHETRQVFGTQPRFGQAVEQDGLFSFVPMPRIVGTPLQVEVAGELAHRFRCFAAPRGSEDKDHLGRMIHLGFVEHLHHPPCFCSPQKHKHKKKTKKKGVSILPTPLIIHNALVIPHRKEIEFHKDLLFYPGSRFPGPGDQQQTVMMVAYRIGDQRAHATHATARGISAAA